MRIVCQCRCRGLWAILMVAGLFLGGCGDDEPAAGGDDVTDMERDLPEADLGGDVGDTSADVPTGDLEDDVSDAVEDLAEEEPQPETEIDCTNGVDDDGDSLTDCYDVDDCDCEICNNLKDDDGDEVIDCADPDCSADPLCPELCANDQDDDADGDTDCDDSECAERRRCAEDTTTPDTHTFSDLMGYFYHVQYPPDHVLCCHDFDGDEVMDNQLLLVLDAIPEYDPQLNMSASVNYGDVLLLVEWTEFPDDVATGGPATFNIFRGIAVDPPPPYVLEDPIGPETNLWADGDGVFQVTRDSFDDRGPAIRFEQHTIEEGVIEGEPDLMSLTVPIPALGLNLSATLHDARIKAVLERLVGEDDEVEVGTVPQTRTVGENEVTVGGGELSGYIHADDIFAFINEGADLCECARSDSDSGPLIEYGERPAPNFGYLAECNWAPIPPGMPGFECGASDILLCDHLYEVCALVAMIPYLLDVDANENGIEESVSVGLFFDITGAHLADPPVTSE